METFHKRAGTTSKSSDFEDVHIANFVLQMVCNPRIQDFHLSSDDDRYGHFDDIVVEINCESGKNIIALQLKHRDKRTLTIKNLQQNKGDFAIVKYFRSFQKCRIAYEKFILFTNLKFEVKNNKSFQLEGEDFYVTLSKFYPEDVFKISEETNYCYKFSVVEDASTSQDSARIQQYKVFFDNFFLYVDQKNVNDLKVSTEKKFRELFSSTEAEFESYLKVISEWSMRVGEKEKLNKKWIQRAIAIHLLSSRIMPLSFVEVNKNRKILRQAISEFDITVFERNAYGKVSQLWGDAKEKIKDLREMNRIRIKYQLSSTRIDDLYNIDKKLLSQLLWIMGTCPLIVTEDQTVYRAVMLCLNDKFIVMGSDLIKKWQKHFSVFQDLSDLQTQSNVYKDIMSNFTCSLQGKKEVTLQILLTMNEKVLDSIKTDDLLEMLDGPCSIGGEKEDLPKPYIDRFLLRNVIDIKYLEKINEDTLIILNCGNRLEDLKRKLSSHKFIDIDEDIKDELRYDKNIKGKSLELEHITKLKMDLESSRFAYTIYVSKDECNYNKFEEICNKNKDAQHCHQFRFRDDGNLDWIRSKGDVTSLENYEKFNDFVEEKVLWSSQPINNINIIISDPGMGKTELMKSFKNNCSSLFWTVVVYPQDIYLFLKNIKNENNLVGSFETFILQEKYGSLKKIEKEMFMICVKQNKIVYVWDALNEISNEYLEKVANIILQFSEKNLLQWITSRRHLKKFLEAKFNVLSITINQFNEDEQKFYIKERLSNFSSTEESEQVINKIESVFSLVEHKDVLGTPLQIFLLTEMFQQNKKTYLDLLNNGFALTDLYHYFIEEKTNIYYKEKVGLNPLSCQFHIFFDELKLKTLKNYEKLALKALLPEEILKRMNINYEKKLKSIQTNNCPIGLITEVTNEIPRFLHASFAEYLVAVYFSKHLIGDAILVNIIFQQKFDNIRFFFDLLLAKSSPPHIAILYKDFDFLKKCNNEMLKRKDVGGRSVLHLACSWGQRYPRLKVKESPNSYIIDDVTDFGVTAETAEYLDMIGSLVDESDVLENDKLFIMTPLSYAQKSDCLFAEIKIFEKQKTQLSNTDSTSINILYYSARFGYSDALDLFIAEKLPFIKTKKFGHSLLHLAGGHTNYILKLLGTEIYQNKIDDKDDKSNTSLHLTGYYNYYETATILIEYGAEINAQNNNGRTPLFIASQKGHEKIVEILIKSGAAINLAMNDGATPLHVACLEAHEKIVELLIDCGADINFAMNDGITPLHAACSE